MWIININKRISKRLQSYFPHSVDTISDNYPAIVARTARNGAVIVDVGGGAQCAFADECPGSHIIAVDISASELDKNRQVSDRRVADVTQAIPLPDSSADIVASRFVLEHLRGAARYVDEGYRVLKPGGIFITLFPNKNAPFSLLNRALPVDLARKIAYAFKDGAIESGVFPAYYEHCTPRAFRRLCNEKGFTSVDVDVMYFQSSYFYFFFPLALASLCYEWIISRLNLTSLSAHVLVCARKPGGSEKVISIQEADSSATTSANSVFSGGGVQVQAGLSQKSSEL
jgi:ubiquinone/menaquinone biosynthesis C-methylase UbiE